MNSPLPCGYHATHTDLGLLGPAEEDDCADDDEAEELDDLPVWGGADASLKPAWAQSVAGFGQFKVETLICTQLSSILQTL